MPITTSVGLMDGWIVYVNESNFADLSEDETVVVFGWIVYVNESNFADLSEDETVVVLPSHPDSNGVRVNFMPIY